MHADNQASTCCYECDQQEEHSGQMFDWWRYSQNGRIIHPPKAPPPPQPYRPPPLRTDQLCWPMYQVSRYENIAKERNKPAPNECDVSKDYWPETNKRCVTTVKLEHARPPWIPASNPKNTLCNRGGSRKASFVIKCEERQKPIQTCISGR